MNGPVRLSDIDGISRRYLSDQFDPARLMRPVMAEEKPYEPYIRSRYARRREREAAQELTQQQAVAPETVCKLEQAEPQIYPVELRFAAE